MEMTIQELCDRIGLQKEISRGVLAFADSFDFGIINEYLCDFRNYDKMGDARIKIQNILGDDEKNIKILTCMLKGAVDAYAFYQSKGISDEIFVATMKCFTRFIDECHKMTGTYAFDREWWTTRQVGCHLFRIGELEYEMKYADGKPVIEIHIPSDADFSKEACDNSINLSYSFFAEYFPVYQDCEYRCHSWLLAPELKNMLSCKSNIINFQNRFKIIEKGEPDTEFIEWLYNTRTVDYMSLPETTSLQRNMKRYLLDGGTIGNALGILIKANKNIIEKRI